MLSGAAVFTSTSQVGDSAVSFGETGDYVDTKYGTGIDPSVQSMSIALWVYKTAACTSSDAHVFGASGPSSSTRMYIRCRNDYWQYRLGGESETVTGMAASINGWDHVVLTLDSDSDRATMYINGTQGADSLVPSFTIGRDFWFGNFNDASPEEGASAIIDEVAIYTDVLTPAEVTEIYTQTQLGTPAAPINLEVEPVDNGAYLTWVDPRDIGVQNLTDYIVEYKTNAAGSYSVFADGTSNNRYATITGLTNGTLYNFRVSAVNASGAGNASAITSATPDEVITWDGSTTASVTQTTSTLDIDYTAAATFPYANEIGFELENRDTDVITMSASTVALTGIYDIMNLDIIDSNINLSLGNDASGITYSPLTDTLFTIHNGNGSIEEITREGELIRTITCAGCGDVEGIEYLSSTINGIGQYSHTFMTSYEGTDSAIRLTTITPEETSYSPGAIFATGLGDLGNLGLEGVAYNPDDDVYYVIREKTPVALYEVDINGAPDVTQICTGQLGGLSDLSDVDYSNGELFLLSHESNSITRVTLDPCTVTVDSIGLSMTQAEGLTWDDEGRNLYVIGEPDQFSRFRVTNVTFGSNFESVVADGTYDMTSYVTDKSNNRFLSDVRTYVVDAGVATPVITSVEVDPTETTPFEISIDFGRDVVGFDVTDIIVGNGAVSNFAGGPQVYTADITPITGGEVTVNIAAAAGAGDSNGLTTLMATQFSIIYEDPAVTSSSKKSGKRRSLSGVSSLVVSDPIVSTQPKADMGKVLSAADIIKLLRSVGIEVTESLAEIVSIRLSSGGNATPGEVAMDTTCPAFTGFYQEGDSSEEVRNIQIFLNRVIGTDLPGTMLYGPKTIAAVKDFQIREAPSILAPWGMTEASGRWYQSTRKRANELSGCEEVGVTLDNGMVLE